MKTLKKSQRLRLIVNGVSFYATVKQVQAGVGDQTRTNRAVQSALTALNDMRIGDPTMPPCGLGGCWENVAVQMSIL